MYSHIKWLILVKINYGKVNSMVSSQKEIDYKIRILVN